MKENKKHPYKRKRSWVRSEVPRYAVVNSDGETIEKFRTLFVAKEFVAKFKRSNFGEELEIVEL